MILAGGKHTGKKLLNAAIKEFNENGSVEVVTVSELGVKRLQNLGQRLANALGVKIEAEPSEGLTEINGENRHALKIRFYKHGEKQ